MVTLVIKQQLQLLRMRGVRGKRWPDLAALMPEKAEAQAA